MPNRLANETSPYLLQHADNPVDWYPWGEEELIESGQQLTKALTQQSALQGVKSEGLKGETVESTLPYSARKTWTASSKEENTTLFDTGMATAFMILRATEPGPVAHPIAGFNESEKKRRA